MHRIHNRLQRSRWFIHFLLSASVTSQLCLYPLLCSRLTGLPATLQICHLCFCLRAFAVAIICHTPKWLPHLFRYLRTIHTNSFSIPFTKVPVEMSRLPTNWNSVWLVNALTGNLQATFESLNMLVPITMEKMTGICYGLNICEVPKNRLLKPNLKALGL